MIYCISCSDASYSVLRDTRCWLTYRWRVQKCLCAFVLILCPTNVIIFLMGHHGEGLFNNNNPEMHVFFGICDRGQYIFIFSH